MSRRSPFWSVACAGTQGAPRVCAQAGYQQGVGLKNRCLFARGHLRRERRAAKCARASSLSYEGDRWVGSPIACRSMSATGRNDPCPCASGRKFKHCCLRALDAEDVARLFRRRINRAWPIDQFQGHPDRPALSCARAERLPHAARRRPHLHARRHGRRRQYHARCLAVGHSALVAPARHRVPRPALPAPAHDARGPVQTSLAYVPACALKPRVHALWKDQ